MSGFQNGREELRPVEGVEKTRVELATPKPIPQADGDSRELSDVELEPEPAA